MDITDWDEPTRIDELDGGERRILACTDEMMLVHYTLEAGDSYVVPPGTEHGVRALEPCRVVDAFAPPLETYRPDTVD